MKIQIAAEHMKDHWTVPMEFTTHYNTMRFGLSWVPQGESGFSNGERTEGPWAFAYALGTTIHSGPYEAPKPLIHVDDGDQIQIMDRNTVLCTSTVKTSRGYIHLEDAATGKVHES